MSGSGVLRPGSDRITDRHSERSEIDNPQQR
jgi:hypothetical protein